jgi:hypothetical protein
VLNPTIQRLFVERHVGELRMLAAPPRQATTRRATARRLTGGWLRRLPVRRPARGVVPGGLVRMREP